MVLAALAVTLGVVVVTYLRRNNGQTPPAPVPALPKGVQRQLSGFTFTRSDGIHRVFTIHADKTLAFKADGATVLRNVVVEFFGQDGSRRDLLRTEEGTYLRSSGDFSTNAGVRIELNAPPGGLGVGGNTKATPLPGAASSTKSPQPFFVDTTGVTYRFKTSIAETAAPVEFRAGPLAGSAVGMNYAIRDGWLELDKNVSVVLNAENGSRNNLPIHLSAAKVRFDKDAHQAEFWGPVVIRQGDRTAAAEQMWAAFDDNHRVTQVKLEGQTSVSQNSLNRQLNLWSDRAQGDLDARTEQLRTLTAEGHVRGESTGEGRKSSFEAGKLALEFSGRRLQSGQASGNVRLGVSTSGEAATAGAQHQRPGALSVSREELTTNELNFRIRPGSTALESAATAGEGRLILFPQGPKAGRRTITAGRFLFGFDPVGRLKTLEGRSGTRIDFMPSADARPGTPPATTVANNLLATFDPAHEALTTAEQTGNFGFKQGDDQARAEKALYSESSDSLSLSGHPEAWDADTQTFGDHVRLEIDSGRTDADGGVRVTHTGSDSASGMPGTILADRATADRGRQTAHYSGNVRAWQGTDVIETSDLNIDRQKQRILAGSPVVSSYLVTPGETGTAPGVRTEKAGAEPLTIRADKLDYSLSGHKGIYQGNVVLRTQDTVLHADRLEVYFAESKAGSQVEQAVAEGHVNVTQPGRQATGDRADYDAKSGKIVMTGGPPTLYDATKGTTTGRRLTFFTLNDSLIVDGGLNSTNNTSIQHVAP